MISELLENESSPLWNIGLYKCYSMKQNTTNKTEHHIYLRTSINILSQLTNSPFPVQI